MKPCGTVRCITSGFQEGGQAHMFDAVRPSDTTFYITPDRRNICTANLPSCTHSPLTQRGMLVPRVMRACPSVCHWLFLRSLLISGGENGGSICCSIRVSVSDVPLPQSRYPQGTEECCLTQGGEGGERWAMAVGGLPLHWLSAEPFSSSYGLDHRRRAIQMNTAWRGVVHPLMHDPH